MDELKKLPNIGNELAKLLIEADIKTTHELIALGAEKSFLQLNIKDKEACFNKLLALEGAIQGIRWHTIDKSRKEELKVFFKQLKKLVEKK